MLKVLMIALNYEPEETGIAPYVGAMSAGLSAIGMRVRVLTAMPHYPQWRVREGYNRWKLEEQRLRVRVSRRLHYVPSRPHGWYRVLSELTFGMRIVLTRWGRPDVIVVVSPALLSSAIALSRARLFHRKTPTVVWIQDIYSLGVVEAGVVRAGSVFARFLAVLERWVLSQATEVVVIHERFAVAVKAIASRDDNVHVVRNWTHLSPGEAAGRAQVRRELGWGASETIALHAGNLGLKQDLGNVVEAGRRAESEGSAVRFVLMGDGGERRALEAQAAGISKVVFVSALPQRLFQGAMRAADVLIVNEHPGLRDMAVPSKLTSYFSSGRPIVAATSGDSVTSSEIAASGAGIRVEPGDPTALLRAVASLGCDVRRSVLLGMRGQAYQLNELSEAKAVSSFAKVLRRVTGNP